MKILHKDLMDFAKNFWQEMGWGIFPNIILRIKDDITAWDMFSGKDIDAMGLCEPDFQNNYFRISLAVKHHKTGKDFCYTLIHELIHVRLMVQGYPIKHSFGHKKPFKKLAKAVNRANRKWNVNKIVKGY
jgi:hypothetical protein